MTQTITMTKKGFQELWKRYPVIIDPHGPSEYTDSLTASLWRKVIKDIEEGAIGADAEVRHEVSEIRHEWWQDDCLCTCVPCKEQGDHSVGGCQVYYMHVDDPIRSYALYEYQIDACRTMGRDLTQIQHIATLGLGIGGEAGEVLDNLLLGVIGSVKAASLVDYIKKVVGHGHTPDLERISKELGDLLWYVATLADAYGLSLDFIARQNIDKLRERYPEGFSSKRSIERDPERG